MFTRVRIAIRFFFFGLAVGVLLAPRSGAETRRLVREKADRLLNEVLDAATLGTAELGGTDAGATSSTRARRSSGGGNGSRSRKSAATETAEAASEATEAAEAESTAAS